MQNRSVHTILFLIVTAQFACTSLWFAGNAVAGDLIHHFSLGGSAVAHLTSMVQFGFIGGTLLFALLGVADRFSPSRIFFCCAVLAAAVNLLLFVADDYQLVMFSRGCTGFLLAGIYPVGMKIAADHHEKGLGKALGWLVGALVLGTAFPHLVHVFTAQLSWKWVIGISSALSVAGGCIILFFVPDGPYRTRGSGFAPFVLLKIFRNAKFRAAAFGYFGHMWELYTFWAFVPSILSTYAVKLHASYNVPMLSFLTIGSGALACIAGGYLSARIGSARTACLALFISGACCLSSPWLFNLPFGLFIPVLFAWGMSVVADSPQFSTLVAQSISSETRGTALTITNSIGFALTIGSIETLNYLHNYIAPEYTYLILAIGPIAGLFSMRNQLKQ